MSIRRFPFVLATVAAFAFASPSSFGAEAPIADNPSDVSEERFELALAAPDELRVGKDGFAELVLEAKAPFKCNEQYPLKFRFKETAGIELTHPVVGAEHVSFDGHAAKMKLPFRPVERGHFRVEGTFSFSVCSADRCLLEKRELGVTVSVR